MNNTNALVYLFFTKIKGLIRNIIRKPIRFILTLLGIALFVLMMVTFSSIDSLGDTDILNRFGLMALLGAVSFLLFTIMVVNKRTALLFLNDANFLFVGPFKKSQIKHYIAWVAVQQMLGIGAMFFLYIAVFFNGLIYQVQLIFKGLFISFILIYISIMYINYYYIVNASKESPKRVNRWLVYVTIGFFLIVLMVSIVQSKDASILGIVENLLIHPLIEFVPFIGWAIAFQNGHYLFGLFIPLILAILFTILFYRYEGDFYEKATEDAIFVTSQVEKMRNSSGQQAALDSALESKDLINLKSFKFFNGGWVLFSRQLLQLIKTKQLLQLMQLILLGLYTIIGVLSQEVELYKIMLLISLLFVTSTESLESDLKRPFIYLIPDSSFKKLAASIGISIVRMVIYSLLSLGVLVFIFKEPAYSSFAFVLNLVSISFLFQAVTVLAIRFIGLGVNQFLKSIVNMIIYLVALIPTSIVLGLLIVLFEISLDTIAITTFIMNTILALVILYFARTVLDGQDIAD